jgi:1-acyl-sn-glycerol-3-phosphate acyltransferase
MALEVICAESASQTCNHEDGVLNVTSQQEQERQSSTMLRIWRVACAVLLLLLVRGPWNAKARTKPWGPRWLALLVARLLTALANLIGVRHTVAWADGLDRSRQHMVIWHPHGALAFSALMIGGLVSLERRPVGWYTGVASILFQIPGLREVLSLLDAREVTTTTLRGLLRAGRSVGLQPGGIPEQLRTSSDREVAYFPPNLSFVRLAIEHGTPLLPCYLFGENQLYVTTPTTRALARRTHALTGMPLLVVYGRWGLPWIVPRRGTIHVRFGRAVEVGPPQPAPSEAAVEEVFARYTAELTRLFDEHKALLPPDVAAQGLTIVRRTRSARRGKPPQATNANTPAATSSDESEGTAKSPPRKHAGGIGEVPLGVGGAAKR